MLTPEQFDRIHELLNSGDKAELDAAVREIQLELNPHPAGQMTHNVPTVAGESVPGIQHKYDQTALFFPAAGRTCHAYCTFCFRWSQSVGLDDMKFANKDVAQLAGYLREHPEITDVLFTGGDPMVMRTKVFARHVDRIIEDPELAHIQTIRIGTKSVAYWPQRYVTDADADDLLDCFRRIVDCGRTVAIMVHHSHPVELSTPVAQEAVRGIRSAGANIRMQSPLIRHVNDDANVWAELWNTGVKLGRIPYDFFVERDTGARGYFGIPHAQVPRDLPRRLSAGQRHRPHRPRPVDVGLPGQGPRARGPGGRRREGIRTRVPPVPTGRTGEATLLREV